MLRLPCSAASATRQRAARCAAGLRSCSCGAMRMAMRTSIRMKPSTPPSASAGYHRVCKSLVNGRGICCLIIGAGQNRRSDGACRCSAAPCPDASCSHVSVVSTTSITPPTRQSPSRHRSSSDALEQRSERRLIVTAVAGRKSEQVSADAGYRSAANVRIASRGRI